VVSLEEVLAEAEADAKVLRQHGHHDQARAMEGLVQKVRAAASEYLDWLSESNARFYTGRSERWLRAHFTAWEQRGLARIHHHRRQYRRLALEHRGNAEAEFAAGQRAARGESLPRRRS
jgi:hypothetical protein